MSFQPCLSPVQRQRQEIPTLAQPFAFSSLASSHFVKEHHFHFLILLLPEYILPLGSLSSQTSAVISLLGGITHREANTGKGLKGTVKDETTFQFWAS